MLLHDLGALIHLLNIAFVVKYMFSYLTVVKVLFGLYMHVNIYIYG